MWPASGRGLKPLVGIIAGEAESRKVFDHPGVEVDGAGTLSPNESGASQFIWRRWSSGQEGRGVPKAHDDSTETSPSFGPSSSVSAACSLRSGQQTDSAGGSPAMLKQGMVSGTRTCSWNARGGAPGYVEKPLVVDVQRFEQPIHPSDAELGEIGQAGAQVRGRDGGHAQDSPRPGGVGREQPGVEPAHAVPDQVDRFAREGRLDLFPSRRAAGHPRDRRDARGNDPVPHRAERFGDSPEIGADGHPAHDDAVVSEQPVCQDDRCMKPDVHLRCQSRNERLRPSRPSTSVNGLERSGLPCRLDELYP